MARTPAAEDQTSFLDRSVPEYLAHAPFSLCLRELNRLAAIRAVVAQSALGEAVLDVGCGDGFWWTFLDRSGSKIYGVDISAREIQQASRVVDHAVVADVSKTAAFPDVAFQHIIGNCSLEHVPDIDAALRNLRRSASANARLVMFVPTPTWALQGKTQELLLRHWPRLAMTMAGALNGFFQHWHLYHHRVWAAILAANGWTVEGVHGLGGRRSEFLFRLFLPSGFLAFLIKTLTGVYPNKVLRWAPAAALAPSVALMKSALRVPLVDPEDESAYEYMIIARAAAKHEA